MKNEIISIDSFLFSFTYLRVCPNESNAAGPIQAPDPPWSHPNCDDMHPAAACRPRTARPTHFPVARCR